jgi:hypothetical protein
MAHHPARPGTFLAGIVIAVVGISCAEAPTSSVPAGRSSSATPVPAETFTVTCTADGGTEVSAAQVEADSDGVHVHVVNRSGEPASLNGLGPDVDPGPSDIVASTPP